MGQALCCLRPSTVDEKAHFPSNSKSKTRKNLREDMSTSTLEECLKINSPECMHMMRGATAAQPKKKVYPSSSPVFYTPRMSFSSEKNNDEETKLKKKKKKRVTFLLPEEDDGIIVFYSPKQDFDCITALS